MTDRKTRGSKKRAVSVQSKTKLCAKLSLKPNSVKKLQKQKKSHNSEQPKKKRKKRGCKVR